MITSSYFSQCVVAGREQTEATKSCKQGRRSMKYVLSSYRAATYLYKVKSALAGGIQPHMCYAAEQTKMPRKESKGQTRDLLMHGYAWFQKVNTAVYLYRR